MHAGSYKSPGYFEFTKSCRGRTRNIKAAHISERIVQKCLCRYYLNNLLGRSLIYDNGATINGKGYIFTLDRLFVHLNKYYKRYHTNEGYILKIDFSKYFDNIDHNILLSKARNYIKDDKIYNLYKHFIEKASREKGIALGSEISQINSLFYVNELDHLIKEKLHIKFDGRYVDDCYLICSSKEELKNCLRVIYEVCNKLKIIINKNKTTISKLKQFTWLKIQFRLQSNGKITNKNSYKTRKNLFRKEKYLRSKYGINSNQYTNYKGSFEGYIKEYIHVQGKRRNKNTF